MHTKIIVPILFCLLLAGCVNPYEKFYQADFIQTGTSPTPVNPKIFHVADFDNAVDQARDRGFLLLGTADFNGGIYSDSLAIEKAKSIGADLVVCNEKYLGSVSSSVPITTYQPGQTYSTTHYGTIYGDDGISTFQGHSYTTTPGTYSTQYVPVTRPLYEHHAAFFKNGSN